MRLDKFLKCSRLIKRRSVANEACAGGRVSVNGNTCKSAHTVKIGDIIEIRFGSNITKVEVVSLKENPRKEEAELMYKSLP